MRLPCMNKSTLFTETSIIKQILKFIPQVDINRTAEDYNSNRYHKKFRTYEHLVTMLFATMSGVCLHLESLVQFSLPLKVA